MFTKMFKNYKLTNTKNININKINSKIQTVLNQPNVDNILDKDISNKNSSVESNSKPNKNLR